MKGKINIGPKTAKHDMKINFTDEKIGTFTGAYVGTHSYAWNFTIDYGVEFDVANNYHSHFNIQIGRFCSIGSGLTIAIATTHNIKRINSGAIDLVFNNFDGSTIKADVNTMFNQKSTVIIQNDVYVGENVTIMPNVIVRNGAVIARNSHVVSDVPPYAIVGGNPAKVIGYRFTKDQIDKLQHIQWWYWNKQELIDHAEYLLSEDIERICEKFYPEANDLVMEDKKRHNLNKNNTDSYFVFVDYYENYNNYSEIMEVFIKKFGNNEEKELLLFVQDFNEFQIEASLYEQIKEIVKNVNEEVSCTIKLCKGTKEAAKEVFLDCKHYIISRTYDAVYFSCLADLLGMDIIFGTDTNIAFEKTRNMYKV